MTRWRALPDEEYIFIDEYLDTVSDTELHTTVDNGRYEAGNYFRFHAEAEAVAAQFRAILEEHHKDP